MDANNQAAETQEYTGVPSPVSLEHFVMARVETAADAGKDSLLVHLGHPALIKLEAQPSGQLKGEELYRACLESSEFPKEHIKLMRTALRRGYEIRASVSKARWADPLEFAPVVDTWVLSWKNPGPVQEPDAQGLKSAAHYRYRFLLDKNELPAPQENRSAPATEVAAAPEALVAPTAPDVKPLPVRVKPASDRLIALMQFAKSGEGEFRWRAVKDVLSDLYHSSMSLSDAMHHLVSAYEEALAEPRFELTRGSSPMLELILSPVKGHTSVEPFGPRDTAASYRVEDIYDSMAAFIFGQLSIARVDWLSPWKKEARAHVEL